MQLVSENSGRVISDYSKMFLQDFVRLLKTAHVDKEVHINQFYQEYIRDKQHIHMNATRWNSLTEFGKYLSREGICRVRESEKGMFIAWIDTSPEALARREAIKRREALDKGDEQRERQELDAQIKRAQQALLEREREQAAKVNTDLNDDGPEKPILEGRKIMFSLKSPKPKEEASPNEDKPSANGKVDSASPEASDAPPDSVTERPAPVKIALGGFGANKPKGQNVFKQQKSLLKNRKEVVEAQPKKMSEMERIMKEDMERKRRKEERESEGRSKRMKFAP